MHRVSTRLRAAVVAGGVTIAAGFGLAASAPADDAARGAELAPAKIKMVSGQGPPAFVGDTSVAPDQELKIVNRTNPRRIGPHFFTLAEGGDIPRRSGQIKRCFQNELKICKRLFRAHEVNFQKRKIGKRKVDSGQPGWDKSFSDSSRGDSWFTDEKGKSHSRTVVADPGTTLRYFCVFHSETMRGKIEVTP